MSVVASVPNRNVARPEYTINKFRARRGLLLRQQIHALADYLGRDIVILDVGGKADYWANVGFDRIARIDVMNYDERALNRPIPEGMPAGIFTGKVGDARNLSEYADQSVDLAHSNSVIEHVGSWKDMRSMASEMMRVGRSGWVQTPAWSFPMEPHFWAPFMHWFGAPMRARMLSLSAFSHYRKLDLHRRREQVEAINLLSKREVRTLFPERTIYVERLILAKSYTARWMPGGLQVSNRLRRR